LNAVNAVESVGIKEILTQCDSIQYPVDMVRLPNVDDIFTISEAWDYEAKVCLHISQMALKFPSDRSLTEKDNCEITYLIF
jgi:hypothetical protein